MQSASKIISFTAIHSIVLIYFLKLTQSHNTSQKGDCCFLAEINRRKRFLTNFAYGALLLALAFVAFKYLFGLLWPFALAFLFSALLRPILRWLTLRWHWRYPLAAAVCLLLFFVLLFALLGFSLSRLATGGMELLASLPALYSDRLEPALRHSGEQWEAFLTQRSPELYAALDTLLPDILGSLQSSVRELSGRAVSAATAGAAALPKGLLNLLICLIATIFMTLDYPHISAFLLRQLPESWKRLAVKSMESGKAVVGQYARSYLLLMAITFGEIFLGLLLIRQKKAALIAALIALFDLFPVVGAGLILLPWALFCLLSGGWAKGMGLLALWVIVIVARQILEPRIVGRSVGLHPLITLMSMFVGARLFGGVGLFGLPLSCAVIKSLDDGGVIHLIAKDSPVLVRTEEKNKKISKSEARGY